VSAGAGRLSASGSLGLSGRFPLKVKAEAQDASLGEMLKKAGLPGAWVDVPATGKGTLTGTLLPSVNLSGEAEVRTGRFVLAARPYDAPPSAGPTILSFPTGRATGKVAVRRELAELEAKLGVS
jgi:translocation and assembly module TamB